MSEIIDDLVVLGMAVPERVTDGRRTVCLAGHSPSMGFIRIYPVRPDMHLHRWDVLRATVERNRVDSRHESWQLNNSTPEWETLDRYIEKVGALETVAKRRTLIESLQSPCVHEINERRDSLGIVRASTVHRAYFADNPQYRKPFQLDLISRPGEWARVKANYPFEPRLEYSCEQCTGHHDQKVLEWGAYEWMHKSPTRIEQYWENIKLYSPDYDLWLLVGNQINQRTSFLVINIIPIKRISAQPGKGTRYAQQLCLFDSEVSR